MGQLVPYDENLLEKSRTQWQFGDWESLAKLERDILQHHPDRAKLALLAAAGYLQTDNTDAARQLIRLAQDWGCSKKLITQIVAAGVHNSLGRASAIVGLPARALQHFQSAITIGTPGSDARLITQARINYQFAQLGLPALRLTPLPGTVSSAPNFVGQRRHFKPIILARHDLGPAWAGNTINTVIFRHHGILTHEGRQTTAFYVDEHTLRLVQRDLATDDILQTTHDIPGKYNLRDAHNSISLGVDRAGYLHISYDYHATQLRYRRSIAPNDIIGWTDELPMTGVGEEQVTYPTFILPHHGYPLTLLYHNGVHDKGTARLKTYDEARQAWSDHPQPILNGAEQKPWTSNAYWNHPAIGNDGALHLSFVWGTHTPGEEGRINNLNIGYACSPDNGLTWHTSHKHPYKLPITQVNAETIHAVSLGSNLVNQTSMALDSRNRPHIVFYSNDPNGIPQYQHLWFDGKVWHHQFISNRRLAFNLQGGGMLQIPISRPEIVLDRHDNAYVIYRGDLSCNRMIAILLPDPDYAYSPENMRILWEEDLGFAEPVIDRSRWRHDNILSLILQHNEQSNNDVGHVAILRPITLLDIGLNSVLVDQAVR